MAVTPAAAAAASAPAAPTTDTGALGRARLAENFDTFLALLTTQLKNQDPLSPLDSNQFTEQLVQMTGVEQQLLTNDLLKKLVSNTGSGVSTAVGLIGKEVRAESDAAGLANGKASWAYTLDRAASDVKLEVLDSKGRVVKAIAPTDNAAGEHSFVWDGKSTEGSKMADGTYSLRVTARDSGGNAVTSRVFADGLVTGVEQSDGQTLLTINGGKVPWDKIVSIRQPPPAPTATVADAATAAANAINNLDNPDDKTSSPAAG
jgi:flagellar basal-body rod modification protein FlgD